MRPMFARYLTAVFAVAVFGMAAHSALGVREGATVASNSTICRSGSTFLCSDGEWVNLGTLCR
jgi:hypothetical protein